MTTTTEEMSLADCKQKFSEIRSDAEQENEAACKELGKLVQQAMKHESSSVADVISFLQEAASDAKGDAKAVILNNLGCIEKRRADLKAALHYFEQAADEEGGLEAASPATLINMSATYSALSMYAEAAAISNHAVLRCTTDYHKVRPLVKAAAYHNLATALEGSGEMHHASEAYKKAMAILQEHGGAGTQHYRVIERAEEQLTLKLRNTLAHDEQERWEKSVRPAISKQSTSSLRRTGELPPLKAIQPSKAKPASSSRALVTTSQSPVTSPHHETRVKGLEAHDVSAVYTASLKKYHALRSADPSAMAVSTRRNRHLEPIPIKQDLPEWNTDPILHNHSLSHRTTPIPKNWDIERNVDENYMPRSLVPLVEDIKYKEATRRRALVREWSKRMQVLRQAHRRQFVSSEEDEARLNIEIEEVRVWKVLHQYIKGKVFFAEGSAKLGKEEQAAREEKREAAQSAWKELVPHSDQLQMVAEEEFERHTIKKEELSEYHALEVDFECALTSASAQGAVSNNKYSLCHALAYWCLESVFTGEEGRAALEELQADKSMKKSLHMQERFSIFGSH